MTRAGSLVVVFACVVLSAVDARAEGTRTSAKDAYERGVAAHKQGDMRRAADEFARADAITPSPVALRAALDAAIEADDPALGSELVERAGRETPPADLAASVRAARARFSGRAGKLRVVCPVDVKCSARLDERPVETDRIVWALTGQHAVVVQVRGETQSHAIDVEANQLRDVVAEGAAPTAANAANATTRRSEEPSRAGLPPIVFYAGLGITLVAGGATVVLGLMTKDKRDAFAAAGCERAPFAECAGLRQDGEDRQLATNVVLGVTAASAVGTAVVGLLFTDWRGPAVAAVPGGAIASLTRRF